MKELADIDRIAWRSLKAATEGDNTDFEYLTLATVAVDQRPMARTLVLRGVDPDSRQLEFHTDLRSGKWAQLQRTPSVCVLGYGARSRLQLRLTGSARLFSGDSQPADDAWQGLSAWTRSTYCGGPPGDLFDAARDTPTTDANIENTSQGRARFGVILVSVNELDWLQLARGNNQRARFSYDTGGALRSSDWLAP